MQKLQSYDLDALRQLIRALQAENRTLRELLAEKDIPAEESRVFQQGTTAPDDYDPDQGSRIIPLSVNDALARRFYGMFWGRTDVFAKRAKNGRYYPQCENRWDDTLCPKQRGEKLSCDDCADKKWEPLKLWRIRQHLLGEREDRADVIGVYPLFPDQTCRFLVFDFDNHEKGADQSDNANTDDAWMDEVNTLRLICQQNGIDALTERSRSGRGAHVWIFFRHPVSAALARAFGLSLLDRGCESINLTSFRFYDRMYPAQDFSSGLGNLVALPLQGQALKRGNSAFVDEAWNAYPDQLEVLFRTRRLSTDEIERCLVQWTRERTGQIVSLSSARKGERPKPWKRNEPFRAADVTGVLHIVLADGIYVDALNLTPRLQNQIRCLATMDNPEFYRRKKAGRSNYYDLSTIYLGRDIEGYIQLPRGLLETLTEKCRESDIPYEMEDHRTTGRPLRVRFQGELRTQQDLAEEQLLRYQDGVLSAAAAFGKTVVCSYLIAQRKVSALILLESRDLVDQWVDELNRFLLIDEEPPVYQTKTGRTKKRKSVIGTLQGGQDKTTGIVDAAMIGSVYRKGKLFPRFDDYGLVIMDECHHAASAQAQQVLKRVRAKYLYGVSATPVRSDRLEKINYMMLGPIRHRYTPKEQAEAQGIELLVRPRFTRVVDLSEKKTDIHRAYELVSENEARNDQIIRDVRACIQENRTPVILTKLKRHAKLLYDALSGEADRVFLLYGDNTQTQNQEIRRAMLDTPGEETMIVVATGQKIGEGFDCPRLDTLMLASPVKFDGRLIQYVGRLNRTYEGKTDGIVYDYVDAHIPIFDNQYRNRLAAYKRIGYRIQSGETAEKQTVNAIFDRGNYAEAFERDLVEAERDIVVASPGLRRLKVERTLSLLAPRQEAGVKVTVVTLDPDAARFDTSDELWRLIHRMRACGVEVVLTESESEHYAVMDGKLVWHGGMNLLGREDAWDNLIRVESIQAATELLEMTEEVRRRGAVVAGEHASL